MKLSLLLFSITIIAQANGMSEPRAKRRLDFDESTAEKKECTFAAVNAEHAKNALDEFNKARKFSLPELNKLEIFFSSLEKKHTVSQQDTISARTSGLYKTIMTYLSHIKNNNNDIPLIQKTVSDGLAIIQKEQKKKGAIQALPLDSLLNLQGLLRYFKGSPNACIPPHLFDNPSLVQAAVNTYRTSGEMGSFGGTNLFKGAIQEYFCQRNSLDNVSELNSNDLQSTDDWLDLVEKKIGKIQEKQTNINEAVLLSQFAAMELKKENTQQQPLPTAINHNQRQSDTQGMARKLRLI